MFVGSPQYVPSDCAIALAEEAAARRGTTEPVECAECPATIECVVDDYAPDTGISYLPAEPGARKCGGCGEIVCRACALRHPSDLACAAEQRAWRRAQLGAA